MGGCRESLGETFGTCHKFNLAFIIAATYDTVPCFQKPPSAGLAQSKPEVSVGSSTPPTGTVCQVAILALTQGQFRWQGEQVLSKPAEWGGDKKAPVARNHQHQRPQLLTPGLEWKMEADLGRRLHCCTAHGFVGLHG